LSEFTNQLNPHVKTYFDQVQPFFYGHFGDAAASHQATLQMLDNLRQQQALSLAYFDVFWLAAMLAVALVPLVFIMKRSVAEKGAHIASE
jgi:DHA2 family multidrug resistance protein